MAFIKYNPNPSKKMVGDCVIRAITKLLDMSWEDVYTDLSMQGFAMRDMPNSNSVWGEYLRLNGCRRYILPNTCPDCYTIKAFAEDHPVGSYIVATGTHVVAVIDGNYYDTGDSGNEVPVYYWRKEK